MRNLTPENARDAGPVRALQGRSISDVVLSGAGAAVVPAGAAVTATGLGLAGEIILIGGAVYFWTTGPSVFDIGFCHYGRRSYIDVLAEEFEEATYLPNELTGAMGPEAVAQLAVGNAVHVIDFDSRTHTIFNADGTQIVHHNRWNPSDYETWPEDKLELGLLSMHASQWNYRTRANAPKGCPVHHIVPKLHNRGLAQDSRELLWKYLIGVHDLANLVVINSEHNKIHTKTEYAIVNARLHAAEDLALAQGLTALDEIRPYLIDELVALGDSYQARFPCGEGQ